jgi:cell surface protein SprA
MKLGPLTLTTLASQKKGEVKEVNVNSGSTSQDFTIRAYNYSTNNYFVDTVYASTNPKYNLFYKYYGKPNPEVDPTKRIVDIQVWKSVNGLTIDRSKERRANAYINLPARTANQKYSDSLRADIANPVPGQIETGRFVLLTPDVDYTLHPETGYITFHTQVQDQDVIAVAYRVENGPSKGDDSYYGEFIGGTNTDSTTNDSTLILKLVKPQNLKPQYTQAWRLLLKNIYSIGGRNIKKEGFEFNIKYEIPGQDAVTDLPTPAGTIQLLHAFGLDNYNSSGGATPDNIFDWVPDVTVLPTSGEIIFPTLQPFGKNLPDGIPDSLRYSSVYDTSLVFAQQDKAHDRWSLTGKYSGEASSVYQLGFNVVENSVRVTLNGRELTAGSDYTVDYNIGQLTIRNSQALVPGADLKITYEQNDLFQLASKTLLGARGVFDFSKKTKLGFSILNLNQQTLSDKVRIGEEPLSNTIMGVDFKTQADLPFLTKGLDNIISTKEMSSFNVSGEVAYMNPDPNTMKSTIPDDGGQSIAYIDDFEGAKRTIPIGVSYTSWKDLSAPNKIPSLGNLTPEQMMDYKAKSFWYTITPSDVLVPMIWGTRKKVATADQQVPVLDYVFLPDTPGTYNYHPKLQDPAKTWGGMMKILSSTANDLQAQNIQYIEFWVHISQAPQNTKFYIDLGRISEDVIPNRKLDTEDKNNNGVIDESEDTGIDGMFDAQERAKYGNAKSDPSGDDFALNNGAADQFSQFFSINGTEGNAVLTDIGRIPDTEDLNLNGNIDLVNSYFRYEVSLDTNAATNPYIAGGGDNAGWYLMRIPLKDTMLTVGQPSL